MADPLKLNINELLIGNQPGLSRTGSRPNAAQPGAGPTFAETLQQAQAPAALKFSAHAQTRLQSRQISIGPGEMQRIEGAVQKAAGKGSRESLVLMDDTAFLVSVANKTVITVVDKDSLKQNVFTNIDSAVIA